MRETVAPMPRATAPTAAASTPPTLPPGIEIFAAGTRVADDGTTHTITEADLAASAAAYDPALHEAPHVVGHPKDNAPAYGWVKRLAVQGGVLQVAEHQQVEPQFAELVAAGRVKKRSTSFYHPKDPHNPKPGVWYVRHVGWLGAQPPAVKGLKDVNFSEDDTGCAVCFSEPVTTPPTQEPDDMSKELEEKLAKAQKDLDAANAATAAAQAEAAAAKKKAEEATAQAANFAERAKADRTAGFVSFCEAQVKAGTLLPKDQAMAVAAQEALADAAPVEFAEGDTTRKVNLVQWLQGVISGAKPKVDFGEFAGGKVPEGAGGSKGKSDAEIDKAARAYMAQHKVNYAEAVSAVVTSFAD